MRDEIDSKGLVSGFGRVRGQLGQRSPGRGIPWVRVSRVRGRLDQGSAESE